MADEDTNEKAKREVEEWSQLAMLASAAAGCVLMVATLAVVFVRGISRG